MEYQTKNALSVAIESSMDIAWSNLSDATTDNGVTAYADCYDQNGLYSDTLNFYNFNFSIPTNASILGVMLEIKRSESKTGDTNSYADQVLDNQIMLNNYNGDDKGAEQMQWWNGLSYESYGDDEDDWNAGLTPADVNSNTFGFLIGAFLQDMEGNGVTAYIDNVRATIYYEIPPPDYTLTAEKGSLSVSQSSASLTKINKNKKRFLYKIYDSSGNFITTWNDVISQPTFYNVINGGFSELKIKIAKGVYQFGEDEDVKFSNQIKVFVFDKNTGDSGIQIYSGYLTRYEPIIDGGKETVEVTFLSYWLETARLLLEDAGKTEVAYNSYDPSNILKDLLDKFTARGGKLDYSTSSVDTTGTTVSYTFNVNTFQECLKKVVELCPKGWYIRTGADDTIYLSEMQTTAKHKFSIGKDIIYFKPEKRIENLVNVVYFKGGGTLYKKYTASGSVSTYGEYAKKIIDGRVTVEATADIIANRELDMYSSPEIRVTLRILDSNNNAGKGYDIESIQVGDTCKILGATVKSNNLWDELIWEQDDWDYDITNATATLMQIQKITYYPDYAELEISNRQPDIARRIEDINRNLVNEQTVNAPTTPTT